jgi:hypothetical protein
MALCSVESNASCCTHIHVSPNDGFNAKQVKAVARAALYFEEAVNALVPAAGRSGNEFCQSFSACNTNFQGKAIEECIAKVDELGNLVHVVNLMNPNEDRHYIWNFTNLHRGKTLTIEFRQGPGVVTASSALVWAEFVVTFVGAAMAVAWTHGDLSQFPDDVGGLKKFLVKGLVPGVSDETFIAKITSGMGDSAKMRGIAPVKLDEEGGKRSKKKKKKKDDDKKVFTKRMEKGVKGKLTTASTARLEVGQSAKK